MPVAGGGVVSQSPGYAQRQAAQRSAVRGTPYYGPAGETPQTTVINGTTYRHIANPNPSGVQGGSIFGNDGSVWSPMQRAAAGDPLAADSKLRARASGDLGPVDFDSAWDKTRRMIPPPPVPAPARVSPISMEDRRAAEAAEFSKAKDIIGRTGRASLKALSGEMRSRGISGSGIEADKIRDIVARSAGDLGGVGLTQAIEALKRQAQIADTNYQGEIGQRGQDIGYANNLNSRELEIMSQRGGMTRTLLDLMARNGGRLY